MLIQHNIDRNDESYNTKAPFTYESKLQLPGGTLPSQSVRSVVVYCQEGTMPPVRIVSSMFEDAYEDHVLLSFSDATGQEIGRARLYLATEAEYVTTFITDSFNVIKGHVCYNAKAAEVFRGATLEAGGRFMTEDNDFELLPQCHVAWMPGHCRAIRVNGWLTNKDVRINPTIEMHTAVSAATVNAEYADTSYVLSMAEPYIEATTFKDNPALNGICKLTLNNLDSVDMVHVSTPELYLHDGIWLGGVNLILRSSDTSNIRVITDSSAIHLEDVNDD